MIRALAVLLLLTFSASAETIRHDTGGSISARLAHIDKLRQSGEPVRIVGACYSACTMYLGLPGVCVSRSARLGFHGPSAPGGMTPLLFEFYTTLLAAGYPEPFHSWFMAEGRYLTRVRVFSGADLIRAGVREC